MIGDLTSAVTLNRYTYAWGDPINMFDPDGHWPSWSGVKNFVSNAFSAGYNLVMGAINWVADHVVNPAVNAVRSAGNWAASAARSAASRVASAVAHARRVSVKATKAAKAEIQKISRQVTADAARMDAATSSGRLATSFTNSIAKAASRLDTSSAHTALAIAGLIPVVGEFADGADAVLYLIEGDTANALLSAAAMLPIGGQAAGLARLGRAGESSVSGARLTETSGGLFRKGSNTGAFVDLPERMSLRNVRNVAREAGIGFNGVKVKIVRDPNLVGRGLFGHTPNANTVTLYPDAFSSRTALRQTLGHERTHVYQWRTFGKPTDNSTLEEFENAAYSLDFQW